MQRRRHTKDLLWLVVACVVASLLAFRANGFWLAMDFRMQLWRGVTLGVDSFRKPFLITFSGGHFKAVFNESRDVDEQITGNFTFRGGRLTLTDFKGDSKAPKGPVVLVLEPARRRGQLRFTLRDEELKGFVVSGPIDLDASGHAQAGQIVPDSADDVPPPPPPDDSTP